MRMMRIDSLVKAYHQQEAVEDKRREDSENLSDLKSQKQETKGKAKEAQRVEADAKDAARESKMSYRKEKKAQRSREQADRQAEHAEEASNKSDKIKHLHMEAIHTDNKTGQNSSGERANDPLKHLAVSSLIGDNIFNAAGETLGRIKDIMIDITEAKISYVVIEVGGFLGMNQKYFAVPMQALTIAKEHRNAFILNETKESLKRFPEFDKGRWPNTNSHVESAVR